MFERRFDLSRAFRDEPATELQEERRARRSWLLGTGTLACPQCDAPVAPPGGGGLAPHTPLECPYCAHAAATREFLSLSAPTRPARVEVRLVVGAPPAPAPAR